MHEGQLKSYMDRQDCSKIHLVVVLIIIGLILSFLLPEKPFVNGTLYGIPDIFDQTYEEVLN